MWHLVAGKLGVETHTDRGSLRPSLVGETRQIDFFSKKCSPETLSSFLLSYLVVVVVVALFSNRYQVEHPTAMCFSTPSGPEDLLPNEEAAQAQLPNQEAARALIELLASTDDNVTGRLFKKGRALPSPTDKSDFIYPLKGGRRMNTLFDTSDVPKELKNVSTTNLQSSFPEIASSFCDSI